MQDLVNKIILDEINKMSLKDKMTGFLVKKKKRGTYQAFTECTEMESKIIEDVQVYIKDWVTNEFLNGEIRKKLVREIQNQVKLELFRKGFIEIL